ncbi:MAG: nucleotidyltransferase domain-containing protein [Bdellovibrionota bacterium]
MASDLLQERKNYSTERLIDVRTRIASIDELSNQPNLGIYVTGSYGRLEAHRGSDLDLFFVSDGKLQLDRTTKTLIDAELIRIAREMEFPPFSNDAQYLQIHSLEEMLDKLGGAEDDFKNFFTARMLLLLESRSVYGEDAYRRILTHIINAYFRDYHDHTGDFRPLFLVNDVLRFWKTLCLNYENRRNRPEDRAQKNKHHLRNLKLKFSRLLICFSTIIPLISSRNSTPEDILSLTEYSPLDRLGKMPLSGRQESLYNELRGLYCSFLEITSRTDVLDWIGVKENRRTAFGEADKFGAALYSFLTSSVREQDDMRFLIV